MEENIKPVIRMEFTKISPEVSEITTRIEKWKGNLSQLFSKYYNIFFGYRHRRDQQLNTIPLKPLTVSLVKRPAAQYKNYFK